MKFGACGSVAAVIGHEAAIGGDDVAGAQCRVLRHLRIDQAERILAVAGAAGHDLLPIHESGAELGVTLAVGADRMVDAAPPL